MPARFDAIDRGAGHFTGGKLRYPSQAFAFGVKGVGPPRADGLPR